MGRVYGFGSAARFVEGYFLDGALQLGKVERVVDHVDGLAEDGFDFFELVGIAGDEDEGGGHGVEFGLCGDGHGGEARVAGLVGWRRDNALSWTSESPGCSRAVRVRDEGCIRARNECLWRDIQVCTSCFRHFIAS